MRTQLDLGGLTPGVASVPPLRRTSQAFARFNPEIRTVVSDPVSTVRSTVTSTAEGVSGGREKRRERFLSSS